MIHITRPRTLALVIAALFLLGASLPAVAHAVEATTAKPTAKKTVTTVKKAAPSKTATKKTPVKKTATASAKKKTTATKAVTKTTRTATVKKAVVKNAATVKKATPVVSAPAMAAPDIEEPTMDVTAASAHPRSMADMANPPSAKGGSAKQVVEAFYGDLSSAWKQASNLGFGGRVERMQSMLDQNFNMGDMMRMAAGSSWNSATPDQQQQLVQSFRNFTAATYASRFNSYSGERLEIVTEKPGPTANEAMVETKLVSNGEVTGLNYLMRRSSTGNWRIVDVYVDGTISEMAARRSEFGSVLRKDGVEALLRLMDEKTQKLAQN